MYKPGTLANLLDPPLKVSAHQETLVESVTVGYKPS